MRTHTYWAVLVILGVACAVPRSTADFVSGSDGSDGAFNPHSDIVIDLAQAETAAWDTPSPTPGNGVYDPLEWAVVFKYTTIDIPDGVTVTFTNHPSGAPVVWLATGDVTIAGTVQLDGAAGGTSSDPSAYAEPGPGGFAGGRRRSTAALLASDGFGPGGGGLQGAWGCGGSYRTVGGGEAAGLTYGNEAILPLIGGSGGAGNNAGSHSGQGGGAGGGAILVASSGDIFIDSTASISARGGNPGSTAAGGGSGGAIRLVGNNIFGESGSASRLNASGGLLTGGEYRGGFGYIRLEADLDITFPYSSYWTSGRPGPVFPPSNKPSLRIIDIDSQPAPADPDAGILTPDVEIATLEPVIISIEAQNVPAGTTVTVRVVPQRGDSFEVVSEPLVGSFAYSTTTATVTFPPARSEIQLRANWTP